MVEVVESHGDGLTGHCAIEQGEARKRVVCGRYTDDNARIHHAACVTTTTRAYF